MAESINLEQFEALNARLMAENRAHTKACCEEITRGFNAKLEEQAQDIAALRSQVEAMRIHEEATRATIADMQTTISSMQAQLNDAAKAPNNSTPVLWNSNPTHPWHSNAPRTTTPSYHTFTAL